MNCYWLYIHSMNHTSKFLSFLLFWFKIQLIDLEPDFHCKHCFIHTLPLIEDISYYKLNIKQQNRHGRFYYIFFYVRRWRWRYGYLNPVKSGGTQQYNVTLHQRQSINNIALSISINVSITLTTTINFWKHNTNIRTHSTVCSFLNLHLFFIIL